MEARLGTALEGRYTIDREIGRGGMATVYLARDVRHHRNVALKVLNPELGAVLGAERFLAEIHVTANLQHPNLLPLFDSGEVDGLLFYVMPYVEGETLRARLEREKQLPVDEAIRIASAIAGALGYAHRHNIVHRDLKPENILLLEGQPLLADFGIALAVSNAGGARITQTGLSLGTPQYMSPEQATGDRIVDGRTDIFSLGAITYEMLVGDPPHLAGTAQAIIAKLLTERPASVSASRPSVPAHVDAAIARALEKLAADRFATTKDFVDALEGKGAIVASASNQWTSTGAGRTAGSRLRGLAPWLLVALLAGWVGWQQLRPRARPDAAVVRVNFDVPPGTRVDDVISGTTLAVSPGGDMIAFTSTGPTGFRLYLRRTNELVARELTDAVGRNLTFSPDGRWLAFTEGNLLRKVSVNGGEVTTIATTGGAMPYGLAWSEGGTIYVGSFSGLWAIPASGGTAVRVAGDENGGTKMGFRWPLILPGGEAILFAAGGSSSFTTSRLAHLTLATKKVVEYETRIVMPLGMVGDQLVYVSPTGDLLAVGFDLRAARLLGEPVQMEQGVVVDQTAGAKASLSPSGTLAYLRGRAQFQPVLVRGGSSDASVLVREPAMYQSPRFSPDGGRVAMTVYSASATDIWIFDVRRNTFTRLTTEGLNLRPEWTADGRYVVFIATRAGKRGIWRQPADGSGEAELLYQPEVEALEAVTSPDMKWLLFRTAPGTPYPRDILAVPLTGTKTVVPIVTGPFTESQPRLSPDGKWLAYQSSESGRFEIYVRPFPQSGARVQVSDNGGSEPIWARSGRSLFYRNTDGEVIGVGVSTGSAFSIGTRSTVLKGDFLTDAGHANYDVGPDGRFLMLKRAGAESQTIVVHNWASELRQKTAARK